MSSNGARAAELGIPQVRRGPGLETAVLAFFSKTAVRARRGDAGIPAARRPLRVSFEGEAGVDLPSGIVPAGPGLPRYQDNGTRMSTLQK